MLVKPFDVCGETVAPSSKSMMQRAVAAMVLSKEQSRILLPSYCDDALAALDIAQALGADVVEEGGDIIIKPTGKIRSRELPCRESGLCMRMFSAIAALFDEELILTCHSSLKSRPIDMEIKERPLRGGNIEVDCSITSQFLSGLLMALPLCHEDSEISVIGLKSKSYVVMTLKLLEDFGIEVGHNESFDRFYIKGNQKYHACDYKIEGDWSGAAFLLVAGAIGGSITVKNLDVHSCQGDKDIVEILKHVGAKITVRGDSVKAERDRLKSFTYNALEHPDLFPPLVSLACFCEGKSVIKGAERLKYKESDRAAVLVEEFTKLGANISCKNDEIIVVGKDYLSGGNVDAHGDHRIAMAIAVAAIRSKQGVNITGWKCVSKSYPNFFKDLLNE